MTRKSVFSIRGILGIAVILLLLCIAKTISIYSERSTKPIYVITKSDSDDTLHYYRINRVYNREKVECFEAEESKTYTVENAYHSRILNNKILNTVTMDTCVIKDEQNQNVEITEVLQNIVNKVGELHHDIMSNKILQLADDYYVVVEYNVNLWTPYELFYYDQEKDKLKSIYKFDGENVIGIKRSEVR